MKIIYCVFVHIKYDFVSVCIPCTVKGHSTTSQSYQQHTAALLVMKCVCVLFLCVCSILRYDEPTIVCTSKHKWKSVFLHVLCISRKRRRRRQSVSVILCVLCVWHKTNWTNDFRTIYKNPKFIQLNFMILFYLKVFLFHFFFVHSDWVSKSSARSTLLSLSLHTFCFHHHHKLPFYCQRND